MFFPAFNFIGAFATKILAKDTFQKQGKRSNWQLSRKNKRTHCQITDNGFFCVCLMNKSCVI